MDDITWCGNSGECDNIDCYRHTYNMMTPHEPHSYSYFKNINPYCEGFILKTDKRKGYDEYVSKA